jgi:hypothetical protein
MLRYKLKQNTTLRQGLVGIALPKALRSAGNYFGSISIKLSAECNALRPISGNADVTMVSGHYRSNGLS